MLEDFDESPEKLEVEGWRVEAQAFPEFEEVYGVAEMVEDAGGLGGRGEIFLMVDEPGSVLGERVALEEGQGYGAVVGATDHEPLGATLGGGQGFAVASELAPFAEATAKLCREHAEEALDVAVDGRVCFDEEHGLSACATKETCRAAEAILFSQGVPLEAVGALPEKVACLGTLFGHIAVEVMEDAPSEASRARLEACSGGKLSRCDERRDIAIGEVGCTVEGGGRSGDDTVPIPRRGRRGRAWGARDDGGFVGCAVQS